MILETFLPVLRPTKQSIFLLRHGTKTVNCILICLEREISSISILQIKINNDLLVKLTFSYI